MKTFLKIISIGLFIGFAIKTFVIESFTVPTDSMTPTILVGQEVWLNKLPFTPKLGDIVGFERNGESFVKRMIGLPSDSVFTEGEYHYQVYRHKRLVSDSSPLTFMKIPKQGETVEITNLNYTFYQSLIEKEGNQIGKLLDRIFINGSETTYYTFKQNYYFVQGDNTEASIDSRQFGLIGEKSLLGRLIL